ERPLVGRRDEDHPTSGYTRSRMCRRPLREELAKDETAHAVASEVEVPIPSLERRNLLPLQSINESDERLRTLDDRVSPAVGKQVRRHPTASLEPARKRGVGNLDELRGTANHE